MPRVLAPLAVLACALALALAAPAGAAQPFVVGVGHDPDVAVDASGAAHVVWNQNTADVTKTLIVYCKIPKGATKCAVKHVLSPPLQSTGHDTYVFAPGGGRVLVESYRCCSTDVPEGNYLYSSANGGGSFSGPVHIGDLDHEQEAVLGPGDHISGITRSDFQEMPLAVDSGEQFADLDAGFSVPTYAGLGLFGDIPVVVMADGDHTSFARYKGSGNVNNENTWIGPTQISPVGNEPKLAGGPAGLTMLYTVDRAAGRHQLVARKFDGTSFGTGVGVSETRDPIFADLYADRSIGRFTAIWNDNGGLKDRLRWATSKTGAAWTKPLVITQGGVFDNAYNERVSAAPDRSGVVVWDENDNTGKVRVVPLLPLGGGPGVPADSFVAGGQRFTLLQPGLCVPRGDDVTLRVKKKVIKQVAKDKRVKVEKVVFGVDGAEKTDKDAPYRKSFPTQSMKSGSKHSSSAKVHLKPAQGDGGGSTKTLKGSFKIC